MIKWRKCYSENIETNVERILSTTSSEIPRKQKTISSEFRSIAVDSRMLEKKKKDSLSNDNYRI